MKLIASKRRGKGQIRVRPDRWETFLAKSQEHQSLFRLQKILVPIDFSEPSAKALAYSLAFARQFGTKLILLHVVEIPYAAAEMDMVDAHLPATIREHAASR